MPINLEVKSPIATLLDSLDKLATVVRQEYEGREAERLLRYDLGVDDVCGDTAAETEADRRALKKVLQALAEALGRDDD